MGNAKRQSPAERRRARLGRVFDRQAPAYARRRERTDAGRGPEVPWRRRLLQDAHGAVLEVAVGAGANFAFYPPDAVVTAVDLSPAMLAAAGRAARRVGLPATFVQADIAEARFPLGHFDAVVTTLGLCSYGEPVRVLQQMRRWLKPTGTLLALEHGLSALPPLNLLLYAIDPLQHALVGCRATRRPLALIRQAGFSVRRVERHYAGLITLVWAAP